MNSPAEYRKLVTMPKNPRPAVRNSHPRCRRGQGAAAFPPRQRGVALFVVIVFVMLSMLLALWASRTSLLNEMVVGNDADHQRAMEAAQALLQDAELDIRGQMADGSACGAPPCRAYTNKLQFPADTQEINPLITSLEAESTRCKDGLCAKRVGRQDFWNYVSADATVIPGANTSLGEVPLSDLMAVGARYGQYTGALLGSSTKPANPILANVNTGQGGWYWIEILPYKSNVNGKGVIVDSPANELTLTLNPYVVFRITALAVGLRPGTTVVLQETYARQRGVD